MTYQEVIKECVQDQLTLYPDMCAEDSSGYESMSGSSAHYEGVKCATESAVMCLSEYHPSSGMSVEIPAGFYVLVILAVCLVAMCMRRLG